MSCKDCMFFDKGYCELHRAQLNLTPKEMEEEFQKCGGTSTYEPINQMYDYRGRKPIKIGV